MIQSFEDKTILVVDDEEPMRKLINTTFSMLKATVLEAECGKSALTICKENDVDCIITDLVMANGNGIDFIREIKASRPELPIIAMSGGGGINGRFDYLEISSLIGANCILKKPFQRTELISSVEKLIAN